MLHNIFLYDRLADEFGAKFRFDIETPAEAIRALAANFKQTFAERLREGQYAVVLGSDLSDGNSIDLDLLHFGLGNDDVHILPVAQGAKNNKGILTAIIGVTLIAGAFFLAPAAAAGAAGLSGAIGAELGATAFLGISYGQIALFGASLVLSGISSMMTQHTDPSKTGPTTASYLLNGPTNNADEGGSVPLIYGRIRVGSTTVSTRLSAKEIAVGSQNYTTEIVTGTGKSETTNPPATPPDLSLPGMTPPLKSDITDQVAWQYPYPEWPGQGAIPVAPIPSDDPAPFIPVEGGEDQLPENPNSEASNAQQGGK